MRIIITVLVLGFCSIIQAQDLKLYRQVDKIKVSGKITKVYFNDPLSRLAEKYPDFDRKDNEAKAELLLDYLYNNPLYVFETYTKNKPDKTYWLLGDPKKSRLPNYFQLEIRNTDNSIDKIIDKKIGVRGVFFEHMMLFQTSQGKASIGKVIQVWGVFAMLQPYSSIKAAMISLIEKDLSNSIPDEMLAKEVEEIEPLFEYQKCGLEKIQKRLFTTTVYQYDSLGMVSSKRPREEKDSELYYSSTSKDLTGVTTFPYFSAKDNITITDSITSVNSDLEHIKHYLEDIRVIHNSSGEIQRIEGKLIIHGYSIKGHTTYNELYVLSFADIEGCRLPKLVKFCPLDDVNYKNPRVTIDIEYELK